jgi:hypothetical protein
MKKAELERLKGLKLAGGAGNTPDRFGKGAHAPLDRREQRERDRELGLVPFAVKLNSELVRELHAAAQKRGIGMNELVDELLRKSLAS